MTTYLRPSDGRMSRGKHINLNPGKCQPGERVLFVGFSGWAVGAIDRLVGEGNSAMIGVESIPTIRIAARVPAGTDEAALIADLRQMVLEHARTVREAHEVMDSRRRIVFERYGIGPRTEGEAA